MIVSSGIVDGLGWKFGRIVENLRKDNLEKQ
jgi:hypothetical protein